MTATHTFKLLTGVEAEVKEITGKEQEILSRTVKGENHATKLNLMLASLLVRVGDVHVITPEFVSNMLTEDRRYALVVARQFSMNFETEFKFGWEYEGANGGTEGLEKSVKLPEGGFPHRPYKAQWEVYPEPESEDRWIFLTLPKSGLQVKWRLLDGRGEAIGAAKKENEISTKTMYEMRRCQYFDKNAGNEGVWIMLDTTKIGMSDLAVITGSFKEHEGKVDTEVQFEHPNADQLPTHKRKVIVDLVGMVNFFYPSGI